jgi:cysteine desulfurase
MNPIYLDNNGTTPVDPLVLNAMLPFLQGEFGNPSSNTSLGKRAHDAIETARAQVARLIGAKPDEITFTSGGTESSNIVIRGAVLLNPARRNIVTTTIEHPATESCCAFVEKAGHRVKRVSAQPDGRVDPALIEISVDRTTALVTVIHAQNEVGTVQPVAEVAAVARRHGALTHIDSAQSAGKIAIDVNKLDVDFLSIAGHKLYAPKGVGALYVRDGIKLPPLLLGAGQEHGRRAGTENVPYIVALGEACRIAGGLLEQETPRQAKLSAALWADLQRLIPGIVRTGHPVHRLPNTLNVLFPGVSGRKLLESCPQVLASNGSACHADSEEPSAILAALGIPRDQALGAVRLSLGRYTTAKDIEMAATALAMAWRRLSETTKSHARSQHAVAGEVS